MSDESLNFELFLNNCYNMDWWITQKTLYSGMEIVGEIWMPPPRID